MENRPTRSRGLYRLPLELLHEILSYLPPTDVFNFIFSDDDLLARLGMPSTRPCHHGGSSLEMGGRRLNRQSTPFGRLPTELLLLILSMLPPAALISLAVACSHHVRYWGIAGPFP